MYQPDIPLQKAPATPAPTIARANYISIERRTASDTVFMVDDTPFHASMPRTTHWSIAWSDLMMTMFILFLSMFVYQTANMDFLTEKRPEVIGGDTTEALDSDLFSEAGVPFAPISPALPLMTAGTVQKVAPITLQEVDLDQPFASDQEDIVYQESQKASQKDDNVIDPSENIAEEAKAFLVESPIQERPVMMEPREIIEPRPLTTDPSPGPETPINDIYRLSKEALASNNLEKFASLDLIPDKTMRIILTGDLLFAPGKAALGYDSIASLQKIAAIIKETPYMINIVGHTDNVPMHSERFASNWELSLARASTVARFLIEDMRMNPNQFVVSGYSSFRPLEPNTNATNRAKNRRVEIIISKKLPKAVPASEANL